MTDLLLQHPKNLINERLVLILSNERRQMFGERKVSVKGQLLIGYPSASLQGHLLCSERQGIEMLQSEIVTEQGAHPNPALGRKRQVLVVDDDQGVRELLSRALTFWGYDVTLAFNGLEAGTLFLTGSYDLVITELHMPLRNGWELSCLVKERSPNTPVMVLSGACDQAHWEKTNMRCVDAIILKPCKLKEIEGTVRRLLNNGT